MGHSHGRGHHSSWLGDQRRREVLSFLPQLRSPQQVRGGHHRFQEARALALRLVEYYDDSWQDYGDGYEYGPWYGEEDEDGEEWYSLEKEGMKARLPMPLPLEAMMPCLVYGCFTERELSRQRRKGMGCLICGSRWHTAPSRPVASGNQGGNKGKSYGSKGYGGYGKGGYGKSKKGYGKSKSRGKGKFRWSPRRRLRRRFTFV